MEKTKVKAVKMFLKYLVMIFAFGFMMFAFSGKDIKAFYNPPTAPTLKIWYIYNSKRQYISQNDQYDIWIPGNVGRINFSCENPSANVEGCLLLDGMSNILARSSFMTENLREGEYFFNLSQDSQVINLVGSKSDGGSHYFGTRNLKRDKEHPEISYDIFEGTKQKSGNYFKDDVMIIFNCKSNFAPITECLLIDSLTGEILDEGYDRESGYDGSFQGFYSGFAEVKGNPNFRLEYEIVSKTVSGQTRKIFNYIIIDKVKPILEVSFFEKDAFGNLRKIDEVRDNEAYYNFVTNKDIIIKYSCNDNAVGSGNISSGILGCGLTDTTLELGYSNGEDILFKTPLFTYFEYDAFFEGGAEDKAGNLKVRSFYFSVKIIKDAPSKASASFEVVPVNGAVAYNYEPGDFSGSPVRLKTITSGTSIYVNTTLEAKIYFSLRDLDLDVENYIGPGECLPENYMWCYYSDGDVSKKLNDDGYYKLELITVDVAGNFSMMAYKIKINRAPNFNELLFTEENSSEKILIEPNGEKYYSNKSLNIKSVLTKPSLLLVENFIVYDVKKLTTVEYLDINHFILNEEGDYEIVYNFIHNNHETFISGTYKIMLDFTKPSVVSGYQIYEFGNEENTFLGNGEEWFEKGQEEKGIALKITSLGEDNYTHDTNLKNEITYSYNGVYKGIYTIGDKLNQSGKYSFVMNTTDLAGNTSVSDPQVINVYSSSEAKDYILDFDFGEEDYNKPRSGFLDFEAETPIYYVINGDSTLTFTIYFNKYGENPMPIVYLSEDVSLTNESIDINNPNYVLVSTFVVNDNNNALYVNFSHKAVVEYELQSKTVGKLKTIHLREVKENNDHSLATIQVFFDNMINMEVQKIDEEGNVIDLEKIQQDVSLKIEFSETFETWISAQDMQKNAYYKWVAVDKDSNFTNPKIYDYIKASELRDSNNKLGFINPLFNGDYSELNLKSPEEEQSKIISGNFRLFFVVVYKDFIFIEVSEQIKIINHIETFIFKIDEETYDNRTKSIELNTLTNADSIRVFINNGTVSAVKIKLTLDLGAGEPEKINELEYKITKNGKYTFLIDDGPTAEYDGNQFETVIFVRCFDREAPEIELNDRNESLIEWSKIGEGDSDYKGVYILEDKWINQLELIIDIKEQTDFDFVYYWSLSEYTNSNYSNYEEYLKNTLISMTYTTIKNSSVAYKGYSTFNDRDQVKISTFKNGDISGINQPKSGIYDLFFVSKDEVNNKAFYAIGNVKLDNEKPTAYYSTNAENEIFVNGVDKHSGIKAISYAFVSDDTKNNFSWTVLKFSEGEIEYDESKNAYTAKIEYTKNLSGLYKLYIKSEDHNENSSGEVLIDKIFKIDTTAPVLEFSEDNWISSDSQIKLKITDETHDIDNHLITVKYLLSYTDKDIENIEFGANEVEIEGKNSYDLSFSIPEEEEGKNILCVYIKAIDKYNNVTFVKKQYNVDFVNPDVSVEFNNVEGITFGPFNSLGKELTVIATDTNSGIASIIVKRPDFTEYKLVYDGLENNKTIEETVLFYLHGEYTIKVVDVSGRSFEKAVFVTIKSVGVEFEYSISVAGEAFSSKKYYNLDKDIILEVSNFSSISDLEKIEVYYIENDEEQLLIKLEGNDYKYSLVKNADYYIRTFDKVGNIVQTLNPIKITQIDTNLPVIDNDLKPVFTILVNQEDVTYNTTIKYNYDHPMTFTYKNKSVSDDISKTLNVIFYTKDGDVYKILYSTKIISDLGSTQTINSQNVFIKNNSIIYYSGDIYIEFQDEAGNTTNKEDLKYNVYYVSEVMDVSIVVKPKDDNTEIEKNVVLNKSVDIELHANDVAALKSHAKSSQLKYLFKEKFINASPFDLTIYKNDNNYTDLDVINSGKFIWKLFSYNEGTNDPVFASFDENNEDGQYELWVAVEDDFGNAKIFVYKYLVNIDRKGPQINSNDYKKGISKIQNFGQYNTYNIHIDNLLIEDKEIYLLEKNNGETESVGYNSFKLYYCSSYIVDDCLTPEVTETIEENKYKPLQFTFEVKGGIEPLSNFKFWVEDLAGNKSNIESFVIEASEIPELRHQMASTSNKMDFEVISNTEGFSFNIILFLYEYKSDISEETLISLLDNPSKECSPLLYSGCFFKPFNGVEEVEGYVEFNKNKELIIKNASKSTPTKFTDIKLDSIRVYFYLTTIELQSHQIVHFDFLLDESAPEVIISETMYSSKEGDYSKIKLIVKDKYINNFIFSQYGFGSNNNQTLFLVKKISFDKSDLFISLEHFIKNGDDYESVAVDHLNLVGTRMNKNTDYYYKINIDGIDKYFIDNGEKILPIHYIFRGIDDLGNPNYVQAPHYIWNNDKLLGDEYFIKIGEDEFILYGDRNVPNNIYYYEAEIDVTGMNSGTYKFNYKIIDSVGKTTTSNSNLQVVITNSSSEVKIIDRAVVENEIKTNIFNDNLIYTNELVAIKFARVDIGNKAAANEIKIENLRTGTIIKCYNPDLHGGDLLCDSLSEYKNGVWSAGLRYLNTPDANYLYYYLNSGSYNVTITNRLDIKLTFKIEIDILLPKIELIKIHELTNGSGDIIYYKEVLDSNISFNNEEFEKLYLTIREDNIRSVQSKICDFGEADVNCIKVIKHITEKSELNYHFNRAFDNLYTKIADGFTKEAGKTYYVYDLITHTMVVDASSGRTENNFILEQYNESEVFITKVVDDFLFEDLTQYLEEKEDIKLLMSVSDMAGNINNISFQLDISLPKVTISEQLIEVQLNSNGETIESIISDKIKNNIVVKIRNTTLVNSNMSLMKVFEESDLNNTHQNQLVYYVEFIPSFESDILGTYVIKLAYFNQIFHSSQIATFSVQIIDNLKPEISTIPSILTMTANNVHHLYDELEVDLDEFIISDASSYKIYLELSELDEIGINYKWSSEGLQVLSVTELNNRLTNGNLDLYVEILKYSETAFKFKFLKGGKYLLNYTVLDISGNKTEGHITFTVKDIKGLEIINSGSTVISNLCPFDEDDGKNCYKVTLPEAYDADIQKFAKLDLVDNGVVKTDGSVNSVYKNYQIIKQGFVKVNSNILKNPEITYYRVDELSARFVIDDSNDLRTSNNNYIFVEDDVEGVAVIYSRFIIKFNDVGTYSIELQGFDSGRTKTKKTMIFVVADTTAPEVEEVKLIKTDGSSLVFNQVSNNEYEIELELGEDIFDKINIVANDNYDGKTPSKTLFDNQITLNINQLNDKRKGGLGYRTVIQIVDNSGNIKEITLVVYVIDTTPPVINENGLLLDFENYPSGEEWTKDDLKFTVTGYSDADSNLTVKYSLDGQNWFDYNVFGIIEATEGIFNNIYFKISDSSNNVTSSTIARTIKIDNRSPRVVGIEETAVFKTAANITVEDKYINEVKVKNIVTKEEVTYKTPANEAITFTIDENGMYQIKAYDASQNETIVYIVINIEGKLEVGEEEDDVIEVQSQTLTKISKEHEGSRVIEFTIPEDLEFGANDNIKLYIVDENGKYRELGKLFDGANISAGASLTYTLQDGEETIVLGVNEYIYLGVTPKPTLPEVPTDPTDPTNPQGGGGGSPLAWILYSVGGLVFLFAGLQILRARKKVKVA